jgi:hypothetical protein
MNKSRRIGAIVALATAAVGVASVAATSPAAAAVRGPQPVSSWLRAVPAHSVSWVNINWRTNQRVCDVEVRVTGRDVDVAYPGHRRSTSFSRGDELRAGRSDYTAIAVNPDFDRAGIARLWATISYDNCGWKAKAQRTSFVLSLPVLRNNNWPGHNLPGGPGFPGGPGQQGPGQHQGPGQQGPGQQGPGQQGPGQQGPGQHQGPGQQGPGQQGPGQQGPGQMPNSPSPSPSASPSTSTPPVQGPGQQGPGQHQGPGHQGSN